MAKMRGIKPETWTDDKFVRLSPLARLLFIGMWTEACDNGHVEDNEVQLKIRLLPLDSCDISELIDEMVDTGQVERFDGYLKVVKLTEHQRIDKRFLLFCEWCDHDEHTTYTRDDKTPRTTSNPTKSKPDTVSAQRAPDEHTTSAQRVHVDEGEGEGERKVKVNNSSPNVADAPSVEDVSFDEFWTAYPKKVGKGQARKAYKTALKKTTAETIRSAARKYATTLEASRTEIQFIANPATWLNGERWEDDLTPSRTLVHNPDAWMDPAAQGGPTW